MKIISIALYAILFLTVFIFINGCADDEDNADVNAEVACEIVFDSGYVFVKEGVCRFLIIFSIWLEETNGVGVQLETMHFEYKLDDTVIYEGTDDCTEIEFDFNLANCYLSGSHKTMCKYWIRNYYELSNDVEFFIMTVTFTGIDDTGNRVLASSSIEIPIEMRE